MTVSTQKQIAVGSRVVYTGGCGARYGTVVGTRGQYLMIQLDGDEYARPYHPSWELGELVEGTRVR